MTRTGATEARMEALTAPAYAPILLAIRTAPTAARIEDR